jgi:glycosyltransferase involved in cell wall biosynthesis
MVASISVVIAVYNGSDYIEQQLRSILCQIGDSDEVILVDDFSSDETLELVAALGDIRVRIFRNFTNIGVQRSFEKAIGLASGDIIFLSDQDDVWMDGKVDRIMSELQVCDLVVTDCKVVDANLNLIYPSLFEIINPKMGVIRNLIKNSYTGCCMAFNRKILDKALPFPKDIPMHDWWIGLIGEIIGSVKFINDPYLLYRRHGKNASTLSEASIFSPYKRIIFRWIMLKNLFIRFVIQSSVREV